MIQQSHSLVHSPKALKSGFQRDICKPKFTAALFTVAMIWKQPQGSSAAVQSGTQGMLVGWSTTAPSQRNPATCDNADEPGGHHAK